MTPRLKALELQGYKTFASKTKFEFPGQITAIVGPNGSGKSNIADAIRWVLGEQAYSILRGKRTVDMIYSGSEQRPRASMASASISFFNEDGWLPIDFSEVTITRRAYRNGENEYLLNGQRVRLKEINELLASSGLAERTYTIIGQGLVDTALSLRPDERRRFFEEAAGIGLYRSRRDDALQKLETTRRNMDRARDILNELKPRLGNLARQAEKARDYENLQRDLSVLLQDWYGYHWHASQNDLSEAIDFHKAQEIKLHEARQKQQEKEKEAAETRQKLTQVRSELSSLHHESAQYHAEVEELTRQQIVSEERQRFLVGQMQDSQRTISSLEELIVNARELLEESRKQTENLKRELEGNKTQTEIIKKELDSQQTLIDKYNQGLSDLSGRADKLREEISFFQSETQHNTIRLKSINAELVKTKQDREQNLTKISILEKEYKDAQQALVSNQEAFKSMQESLDRIIQERQNAEVEKREYEDRMGDLKRELNILDARYQVFEQAEKTHNGFITGSKIILEKFNSKPLDQKIHTLISLIDVDSNFENAIASVLGDSLEGILINKKEILLEALDQIARSESIRTVLLPVELMRLKTQPKIEKIDSECIPAISVIHAKNEIRPVLEILLQDIYIVNSLEKGLAMQSKSKKEIFVTLEAEILYPNGMIIAGKEMRVKTISRQREQRDIKQKSEDIEGQIEKLTNYILHVEKKILKLLKDEENSRKEIANHRSVLMTSEETLHIKKSALEQKKAILEYQVNHEQESIHLIESTALKVEKTKKAIIEKQTDLDEILAEIQKQRKNIQEIPLENARQNWIAISTALAVSEEAMRNAENRLSDKKDTLEKLELQLKKEQENLNSLQSNLQKEKDIAEQLSQKIESSDQVAKTLEQKIKSLEHLVEHTSDNQSASMQAIDELRQAFSIQERHTLQAQLRMTRLRENVENLRKRIEEDLGFIEFEYVNDLSGPKPLPIDGWVAALPKISEIKPELEEQIKQKKAMLRRIGAINPEANKEYQEVSERTKLLNEQLSDLEKAESDLRTVVTELDELMTLEFKKTFKAVETEFKEIFSQLFGGGSARLITDDEENITETGIEIEATLPGRRMQDLALLSGGERSLTAVALIFALLKISPTPFCVLDEVDAMLDESNVMRFGQLMRSLSEKTQFVVITHNRNTVQLADVLYGVTMGRDSASQVISLRMDELTEEYVR